MSESKAVEGDQAAAQKPPVTEVVSTQRAEPMQTAPAAGRASPSSDSTPAGTGAPLAKAATASGAPGTASATTAAIAADDSTPAAVPEDATPEELLKRFGNAVVYLIAANASGKNVGVGTGFIIDATGLVVTNLRSVNGAANGVAMFRQKTQTTFGGVVGKDPAHDLALVQLSSIPPGFDVTPLKLRGTAREGEAAVVLGYLRSINLHTAAGRINALPQTANLPQPVLATLKSPPAESWIQTDACIPGSAGGALLSPRGEILGVTIWSSSELAYAVPAEHIADLVQKATGKPSTITAVDTGSKASTAPDKLDERIPAILRAHADEQKKLAPRLAAAKPKAAARLLNNQQNLAEKHARDLLKLAEADPAEPVAYQALTAALEILSLYPSDASLADAVIERLSRDHLKEPSIVSSAAAAALFDTEAARDFLRRLTTEGVTREVQGVACFSLANALERQSNEKANEEAIALLERVTSEFADVYLNGKRMRPTAERRLFALKNLAIGKTAPEIVGKDLAGKEFKLSDYKGKVVVVDFFGDWCGYCKSMYPLERDLVEQHDDASFALLGVNTDTSATLKALIDRETVTWRCWADGNGGGPIADQWQVTSYPTIYVIDHAGVIRHFQSGRPNGARLRQAVTTLIKRAQSAETSVDSTDKAG